MEGDEVGGIINGSIGFEATCICTCSHVHVHV